VVIYEFWVVVVFGWVARVVLAYLLFMKTAFVR
jgi:hypothetical protein